MDRRTFLQAVTSLAGTAALTGGALAGTSTASAHIPFEPLGSVAVPGAKEATVHHDDEVAYVATGDGFAAVDISDPREPEILAERRGIENESGAQIPQIWDLWPWENRLVVAGPAQGRGGDGSGFALFDIEEPSEPEQVAAYETAFGIHNCYFDDGMVYLTGSSLRTNPLVMIDVTDDSPEEVGRWSIVDEDESYGDIPVPLRPLHDIYVQDDIAYLSYWEAGAWIVDVSEPASPSVRSRVGEYDLSELMDVSGVDAQLNAFTPPGNAHYAQVNDDATVLAVGKEAWATETTDGLTGGAGGVDLYDIEDESDPTHLSTINAPESYSQQRSGWFTTAHNLDITGDRLYTSWYFGGVKIHDISDPENPGEIAWWRNPAEASFWTAQSAGEEFVASSLAASGIARDAPNDTREALYVFPDMVGEQHDPPSLTDPPRDLAESGEATGNESEDTVSDGGESVSENTSEQNTTADSAESADDGGPGFGAGVALAGLGGASYLLARRRGSDGSEEFSE
ncbi:PGF-CTERM sorting domain-containing protein [Halobacteriaceae archaeon SHR40]|uniref:PGF-CTERM sorting domain-containing protein n=1 Tax=Halovenus amylolytica TaxID=2500550 RepID=UPI000FE3360C